MITVHVATLPAPPGPLWVAGTQRGLLRLGFGEPPRLTVSAALERHRVLALSRARGPLAPWIAEIREYLAGGPPPEVPLDVTPGSAFAGRVLEAVARIPYGAVRSFDAIARGAGTPRGARAVGRVLASNPVPIVVPCHRVVAKDGDIAGYIGGAAWKRFLLDLESAQLRLPRARGRRRRRRG